MLIPNNGLRLHWGTQPSRLNVDLCAITVIRDEMWRVPFFLAYHRWIGVRHFIFIDNNSTDGLLDYLDKQTDITVFRANGNYANAFGLDWIQSVIAHRPPETWNLILDTDELFVPPSLMRNGMQGLLAELELELASIAFAVMIDCYPARFPMTADEYQPIPWKRAPYFDRGPYIEWPTMRDAPKRFYHGVRERLFFPAWKWRKSMPKFVRRKAFRQTPPAITKALLVRNISAIRFKSIHHAIGATRSNLLCGLLHYKLDLDLSDKVLTALREKQHWDNSSEYKRYSKLFRRRDSNILSRKTCKFDGVESLRKADVLCCSPQEQASFHRLAEDIWRYGDDTMQKRVWTERWGASRSDR